MDPALPSPTDPSATGDLHFAASPRDPTLTGGDAPPREGPPPIDAIRNIVPGYEIVAELGRGGMGVVYLAKQIGLNRAVALKMILSGAHAGTAERERFRREAEAVAALQHPNIVQIHDVGEADGRPYLAFEYVGGGTLAGLLGGQPWPAKPAADLIEALARAMYYAHLRGIVHRDLKPANVLLSHGERPGDDPLFRMPTSAQRVPKITDFGLAKRVEPDSSWSDDSDRTAPQQHTRSGAVVGTPSYLAPEQAAGKNRQVGPHTDIYALGAMLYELLTGRPPFRGETPLDTVLQVMADEPVPPSKLRAKLPRDLETICLKALQKEPHKRYSSAGELADDLRRFQDGLTIAARPVGRWERAVKWMNRHPAATVLATTSAVAVASLLAVSLWFNYELNSVAGREEQNAIAARQAEARALSEKAAADAQRIEAETQKKNADLQRIAADSSRREAERGVFALQLFKAAALGERDPQRAMRLLNDRRWTENLRDFTWRYIRGQCLVTEDVVGVHQAATGTPPASKVVVSPDGTLVATVSGVDPMVRVYDLAGRKLAYVLVGHQLNAQAVAWSKDGKRLATAAADNTVRLWDLPEKRPEQPRQLEASHVLNGHASTVTAAAWSDGQLATGGADGVIRIWDVRDAANPTAAGVLKEHVGGVHALAWAATNLVSAGADGRVLQWELNPSGGKAVELFKMPKQVLALAVSPDGDLIAAAGDAELDTDEPFIQLYRPITDRKAGELRGHVGLAIYDLSFSADGKRIASAGRDGTVRVWDTSALHERAVFRPEKEPRPGAADPAVRPIRSVCFGKDGLSLVSGGQDGVVRAWGFSGQRNEMTEMAVRAPLASAALSGDGSTLVIGEKAQKQVKVWRLGDPGDPIAAEPTRTLTGLEAPPQSVAVSADGKTVAAATLNGLYAWTDSDKPARIVRGPVQVTATRRDDVAFVTADGQLGWVDARTGKAKHSLASAGRLYSLVAFTPDGRKLIAAGGTKFEVWDAETGMLLFRTKILAHLREITALAVRPGDTTEAWEMATADAGGSVHVWELRPKPSRSAMPGEALEITPRPPASGLNDPVETLAFTRDGRTLASGGVDRSVRLRDPETGQERAALAGHSDLPLLVAFRADQVMLSVGREGVVRVWRAN